MENKNISREYELYNVEVAHTPDAVAKSKADNGSFKGSHSDYSYKKVGDKITTKRMHPTMAEAENTHSHNSKLRLFEVGGSEIDHSEKQEAEAETD